MADITQFSPSDDSSLVFHKNNDLFKRVNNSWEFFFRNTEDIRDIVPLKFGTGEDATEGILIISDNKITKWTNFVPEKKVYLKVRDRAGNESIIADDAGADTCAVVSLDLQSIKDFIPSGRIMDVDEYGQIVYSFDSPDSRLFYGGDKIDTEIGTYESEIFNGSNNLVSWKSIMWQSTEPVGTSVIMQYRSGANEDEVLDADWSEDLIKNDQGFVSLEFVSDQYIQYRSTLRSTVRDISPTLSSVTLRNLTSSSTHFFTTNFILPGRVVSGILTENSVIVPVTGDIIFGINTKNSTEFTDYQIIEPNRIFTSDARQWGSGLRVGVKFLTPGISNPSSQDPYNSITHSCGISFPFTNTDTTTKTFQFKISFFNDVQRTQEEFFVFTGNNQTGWQYGNSVSFPAAGISIPSNSNRSLRFVPGDDIPSGRIYYLVIEAYSDSFEDVKLHDSYVCGGVADPYDEYAPLDVPILKNLSIIFSLEDGTTVKINDLSI